MYLTNCFSFKYFPGIKTPGAWKIFFIPISCFTFPLLLAYSNKEKLRSAAFICFLLNVPKGIVGVIHNLSPASSTSLNIFDVPYLSSPPKNL